MLPILLPILLPNLLSCGGFDAAAQAPPPVPVDEGWRGLSVPVVGEGEEALTVVLRGAPESARLAVALGEVEGELTHLGLAIFAVQLRGVPAAGELVLSSDGRTRWAGSVRAGDDALLLLDWQGAAGPAARVERLAAAPDPAPAPRSTAWPWLRSSGWLVLCLLAMGAVLRGAARPVQPRADR